MKATITALGLGLLAGATAVVLPTPIVSAETIVLQEPDPQDLARTRERNGVIELRPTNEEYTPEQAFYAFDPENKDVGVVVAMNTGRLNGAAGLHTGDQIQVGNMQGACMPVNLIRANNDTGVTIQSDPANYKYITQRKGQDQRVFNNPSVVPLGGNLFAVMANWDLNNNTNTDRYLQVVDDKCNLVPLTGSGPGTQLRENNTSIRIMAKNNDNCAGIQSGGGGEVVKVGNTTSYVGAMLCNGNGRDDAWINKVDITCAADGSTCDVVKQWDTSYIAREERSRGRCAIMDGDADGAKDMAFCCGTAGNSQPQRDGVWCAAADLATGDLLYRDRIAYRGETDEGQRTYAMRMKMLPETDMAGNQTGNVFLQYQMHRGNNNGNKKGGTDYEVKLGVATPTRQGADVQQIADITLMAITSRTDMTHSSLFHYFTGPAEAPKSTIGVLAGNFNANSVTASSLNITMEGGKMFDSGVSSLQGSYDHNKYSKYLGNNPNNQGRNFNKCGTVANPFAAEQGQSPVLNVCAMTGKVTTTNANPELKPDITMEIWKTLEAAAPTPGPAPAPGVELPTTPDSGDDAPLENGNLPGQNVGGCSVSNGSMGGSAMFVLFGLALALRRRRS